MKKIFSLLAAVMAVMSLSAENYFLRSTWGEQTASWKQMVEQDADTYVLENMYFDGKSVAINTVADATNARIIKPERIKGFLLPSYEEMPLTEGDTVVFMYTPSEYSAYDPSHSGLSGLISKKGGYCLKSSWGEATASWKAMTKTDEDTYIIENVYFDGKSVELISSEGTRTIKAANIKAFMLPNYEEAVVEKGDSIVFMYTPSEYNHYNEKESGLYALIVKKGSYALKGTWGEKTASWKNMEKIDDDTYQIENVLFDGADVQLASAEGFRTIKATNIKAYMLPSYEDAVLEAGDSIVFMYTPSEYSAYDPKYPGLSALITKKHGYAIKGTWGEGEVSWKALEVDTADADWWTLNGVYFDGQDVWINNYAGEVGARKIKVANIKAYIANDFAQLSKGDTVDFIFRPSLVNQYDEKESGLNAIIEFKNGYALKANSNWVNLKDDDEETHDWWISKTILFNGENVAIVTGNLISTIKVENINAYIVEDDAELSAGDSVMFIFRPSLVNRYNEKESGLNAIINFKNGYALKNGAAWKNLTVDPKDEDWWTLENVCFAGKDMAIVNGNFIRSIKVENVKAYIDYDDAALSAGDTVEFIYRPSLYNAYDVKESGLNAIINFKNGYAIKGTWGEKTASWKNMVMKDEDTYLLDSVTFDGKDVALVKGNEIRTIKVENIPAYILPSYEETVLAEGDFIAFMYTPSEYASMDPKKPGLNALIIEQHKTEGFEFVEVSEKAVKVIMNGQFYIIKNGKAYNATGVVVE